jgi:Icc-related predicted phosphoesterase
MKIWHIGDTHGSHKDLKVPEGVDMVIFSGDCSNPRNPYNNEPEVRDFLTWYDSLPIKYKVFVAGNHDSSIEFGLVDKETFSNLNIVYLENDYTIIEGIKIYGSPLTPTFGDWAFMKSRSKISRYWDNIPEDSDIIVTHGPPKGILDLSHSFTGVLEECGCGALRKKVAKINPKFMLFGHIHDTRLISNAGTRVANGQDTIFSNGSCVTDGKGYKLTSNGNILNY